MPSSAATALLTTLTAQLHSSDPVQRQRLDELQDVLASALLKQNPEGITSQHFLFEESDLVFTANRGARLEASAQLLEKVEALRKSAEGGELHDEVRIFVRTLPVRTTQLAGGIRAEAAGSRATTIGPFTDVVTGRPVIIDVVKVRKLVPLYVQGQAEPVLLFNAEFSRGRLAPAGSTPELTRTFKVIPDTVWILGKLLDPATPAGLYAGLRVKGGSINLTALPTLNGGKLTIKATTTAECSFDLEQSSVTDADATSLFGVDARNADFELPKNFRFSFKGLAKTLTDIAASSWRIYGSANTFTWSGDQACVYNSLLGRLAIPLTCGNPLLALSESASPFCTLAGTAAIARSWWGLPVAKIDIAAPTEADGNGALIVQCEAGLSAQWKGLQHRSIGLPAPFVLGEPGRIAFTDFTGNGAGATQTLALWQDEANAFGSTVQLGFGSAAPFLFNTLAKGDEVLASMCDADVQTDRPVKVDGHAVPVRSRDSLLMLAVSRQRKLFMLLDENMLWDNKLPADKIPKVRPFALALHNALFTVTPPNGLVMFAELDDDYSALKSGRMFLYFGLFSYLPTLPDPYAANLGVLESQFRQQAPNIAGAAAGTRRESRVSAWLIGHVQWQQVADTADQVGVSFHFAPLATALQIEKDNARPATASAPTPVLAVDRPFLPAFTGTSNGEAFSALSTTHRAATSATAGGMFGRTAMDDFALLDVSSKANQMGVAFSFTNNALQQLAMRRFDVQIENDGSAQVFPVQIVGLDVVTPGRHAQAFTVPQISWEPVLNTTPPQALPGAQVPSSQNPDVLEPASPPFDPPLGWNYYQNDGFATRIGNLGKEPVALSPIPMAKYLVNSYRNEQDGRTYAMFNLPFGMLAISFLDSAQPEAKRANIENIAPVFDDYIIGGIQLELSGGVSVNPGDSRQFEGFTFQLHNINDVAGNGAQYSNLAHSPDIIFNGEFAQTFNMPPGRPAVPLEKIGISGYGASTFSNWENKDALFAQTSQAFFNVATGRTSREVVQVKSMVYPWGIRVVRTITLFRMGNGYVARVDSGWQAQSDGLFDFRYPVNDLVTDPANPKKVTKPHPNPFSIHPGPVRGLRNIRNIREIPKAFTTTTQVVYLWKEGPGGFPVAAEAPKPKTAILQGLSFDCDVEIDNVVEGGDGNLVPSKGVTGYVQLAPPAAPIDAQAFKGLMAYEKDTIGGAINCTIRIAGTRQRMRLDRFDVNASQDAGGAPVFAAAVRGAVVLPKDGSWTLVQHARGSGDVTPMPDKLSVPLIAEGQLDVNTNTFPAIADIVQRIAFPNDLLKVPDASTVNFGFLQNMNTQKVLFLTPAFKKGMESLMSRTPPLLADAYRLMNTSSIFPNVGDAESNFGTAIQLLTGIDGAGNAVEAFSKPGIADNLGNQLYEVLELKAREEAGKLLDQGYKLIKAKGNEALDKALKFDLPNFEYPLVDLEDTLKIYIEYKAKSNPKKAPKDYIGKFDFDIDSFAGDLADTWKGRLNNLAMVVDLGPLTRLMTIKGNFNSQKGRETDYGGDSSGANLPLPEIEFSDAVDAVIKILEILAALSTGKYGDALKKGLKVAMSNSANLWEYKFEASKDIALVRFPPEANLYEAPTTPLKLEASMSLGVFFNAALKVTSDPAQLLPTAGAFFKFHGGLQVMCVSLAAGTVYAVGNADLMLRADTSPLISLTMKFGFGAQITVGLPVIANVSVLFMVGVEVYVDSSKTVIVTAILLFRGHAEILGGIVSVTITIEARGSIEKAGDGAPCNCKAQVTFGLDISVFMVINLSFSESWEETRQIA